MDKRMRKFERRYHCTWMAARGPSPLAQLGTWMVQHRSQLAAAPRLLLVEAAIDVMARLPRIAAREPTGRHRKHFTWLLRWQRLILDELERPR